MRPGRRERQSQYKTMIRFENKSIQHKDEWGIIQSVEFKGVCYFDDGSYQTIKSDELYSKHNVGSVDNY